MSLENFSDKVRNIQMQIGHNIKFGQRPPSLRKSEGDEGSSDEEEVPQSPLRVVAQVESEPQEAEAKEKAVSHDVVQHSTPVQSPRTKLPPPPGTIESINLDAVPQSVPRLDNTAAKHKLSVKPKNQRVSRKHRRFTQDFQKLDLSEMQEETETQIHEEVFDLPSEDYNIMHRIKEDYEPTEKYIRKQLHEEEQERLEVQRSEQEEERNREKQLKIIEEQRLKEEQRQKKEDERKQQEEEEKIATEEEQRRKEEHRLRQEEERNRQEEEERMRKEERRAEERRRQELEVERFRLEEESKREQEERRRKEADKLKIQELKEKQKKEEEQWLNEEQIRQQVEEAERKRQEKKREEEERKRQQQEEKAAEKQARATDPEWKRKAEELRWREMEERQRPFTFKVSSGEKQILFQRVNLTPVIPATGQQSETTAETREGAKAPSPGCADSPLSSSLYVPHTAILVTGAQLCGTAVNLDQIKDTACKSLLGLPEGKKAMGIPQTKSKTSPERKSEKMKSSYESSVSADQSNAAVLAEWASIRSKIFKGADDGKYNENLDESRKQSKSRPISEDLNTVPLSHTNLRKTLSASAKFSITPARKKFAASNRNSEIFRQVGREGENTETTSIETPSVQKVDLPSVGTKIQNRGNKFVRIADSPEECKFAKDFPSFLVPSPPHGTSKSQRSETGSPSYTESEDSDTKYEGVQKDPSCNETPSPFGIKLRRTNYSLRFHNEQSAEKRKKRYSAGDSFEGVPVPLTSIDKDSDTSTLSEKSSPASPQQETDGHQPPAAPSKESQTKFFISNLPSAYNEGDNIVSKPPLYQKPSTSPKPSEGATPPHSPLPKPGRRTSGDMISQRTGKFEQVAAEWSDETSASGPSRRNGEDEVKEKKSFFPSISIPWREKTDRRTELIKREKLSLQIRHSLDSSQTQEKEAGPLWVNLALQKQKGFREQQQNREERKSQREVKMAEKQDRDRASVEMVSPTEYKGNRSSSPPKPQTADENKRPDTLLARFERRENLKKANTLPSSVTVEITDSTPSPPATKDVTKRFPPGDTTQVSTEPAWLALAKRKAKAWSECPQIIK
ncbi:capping protein inhibiting regulator of actin dynamics-like isoform X2 [Xyrauchen texanus]|nr:capping protein inhibiting regulator of actin dynamics-like isoform X2 [Xyrauchen texanus]